MRATNDNAKHHALERAARREHHRLAREKLVGLRAKLREALAAKKARMKALVQTIREQRVELRAELKSMRARVLQELRDKTRDARAAARERYLEQRAQARKQGHDDVARARAEIAAERQYQAEQRRIERESRALHIEHLKGMSHKTFDRAVHATAILGGFGPLYERVKDSLKTAPGQTRAEAFLDYAEKHPAELHAALEPKVEQAIQRTEAEIAHAERSLDKPEPHEIARAARQVRQRTKAAAVATKTSPANQNASPGRYGVHWRDPEGRTGWVLRHGNGSPAWTGSQEEADDRARKMQATSSTRTDYDARVYPGAIERERLQKIAERPEKKVKAPELRDTAKIAARIRADIHEAVKARRLPKAKYSVRTDKYSMGSSIDVVATKLPFPVINPDAFFVEKGTNWLSFDSTHFQSRLTPKAQEVETTLDAIVDAYHWDRSDSMSDIYNERFAKTVKVEEEPGVYRKLEAAKIDAARAKASAPSASRQDEDALREVRTRAVEAMRKADKKRQQLTENFEGGRFGKCTRVEMYDAVAAADRDVAAKSALLNAAETAFREGTGRDVWHEAAPSATTATATNAPNAYEQKKAARIDRMRDRAHKLKAEAEGAHNRAHSIASVIPLGQPILVGHHSEKRHRRDIERIDRGYRKSFELSKKAEEIARRADFAEKNRAISSDDPSAVGKLRAKLAKINDAREKMRAANAILREGGDVLPRLVGLGFSEEHARNLLKPDFANRVGFADYALKNASAEAGRLERRISELEAKATAPAREELAGDVRISEADNRVRVVFPSIPPEKTRKALKGAGFRWAPSIGAWQRHASHAAWFAAREIAAASAAP